MVRLRSGGKAYIVDLGDRGGQRIRRQFQTAADARNFVHDARREAKQIGVLAAKLPMLDRVDAARARVLLPSNVSLETAVRFYLEKIAPAREPPRFIPSPGASAEVNRADAQQWNRWTTWLKEHDTIPEHATEAHAREFAHDFRGRAKTWRNYRGTIGRCYRLAGMDNPAAQVNVIGAPKARRALSAAECSALLAHIEHMVKLPIEYRREYRLAFLVGLYTGARLGDVCNLQHENIDREGGVIKFTPHKTEQSSGVHVTVPLHPVLAAELPPSRTGPLVPWLAGRYARNRHKIGQAFSKIFLRANVAGASFHCLRHTFISRMAATGAPESITRLIVGHSSTAMTRHYTHVEIEAARRAVCAMPAVA